MMRIPFSYIWRSLWARRLTTGLTIGGVALVVFVFAGVLMLARGLEATLVESGSPDNAIVLRRSATSELSSQVDRATADVLEADAGVARGAEGRPLLSREVVLVIDLYKKKSNALGNVSIRGVSSRALELRRGVHIVQGRPFQFGTHEVVVGKSIANQFKGVTLGAELAFGGDRWSVVGISDAGGTAFDSEIWGDADPFMQAFGRPVYSSLTFLLESVVLALVGGALGVALAALLSFARISVINFQSFSEIGFGFALSPGVVRSALVFAVVMGVVGGFLPAVRVARLNIVNALRAS